MREAIWSSGKIVMLQQRTGSSGSGSWVCSQARVPPGGAGSQQSLRHGASIEEFRHGFPEVERGANE